MKVSVGVLTYNHEPFIGRVIESILAQETDFPFEVIICDDCSTDNTATVARTYSNMYPDKVRVISATENRGVFENSLTLLESCLGEFVAMVDGDDWWTSPTKLQAQINALEHDSNAIGSFHDAEIIHTDYEGQTVEYYKGFKLFSQVHQFHAKCYPWDIVERTVLPTSSVVFRNKNTELINQLRPFRSVRLSLVWVYHLLLAKYGYFIYLNEPLCVYNNNKGGLTKTIERPDFILSNIFVLNKLLKDEYYRNLKHHIYGSMAKEISHYLFSEPIELSIIQRIRLVWKFNLYTILYAQYRSFSLIKRT